MLLFPQLVNWAYNKWTTDAVLGYFGLGEFPLAILLSWLLTLTKLLTINSPYVLTLFCPVRWGHKLRLIPWSVYVCQLWCIHGEEVGCWTKLMCTLRMTVSNELRSALVTCNRSLCPNLTLHLAMTCFAYSYIFIYNVQISSTPLPRAIPLSLIPTRRHS